MMHNYLHDKQIAIDKNNPKISITSVTNFHFTLAWAKENFPVLRDLLGPIEPEMSIFFRNCRQYFIIQVLTLNFCLQKGAERSLAQNVPTNLHFVKYDMLRFEHGPLVFLLYNFINKIHANIDTELCTRLNFFDL